MPLYPMPRTLSNSQKASFLRRRILDTETVAAKEITFVEKNYPLFEKKVTLLNQMRREQTAQRCFPSSQKERERSQDKSGILENALRLLNRLANGSRLIRAISNLRNQPINKQQMLSQLPLHQSWAWPETHELNQNKNPSRYEILPSPSKA